MGITVRSASSAVRRTLADLAAACAPAETKATLVIEDGLHPPAGTESSESPVLRLVAVADAEDDITCPISPSTLAEQITARLGLARPLVNLAEGWELDSTARQLRHPKQPPVTLTEKESLLLAALAESYPHPCKRELLLKDVWAYDQEVETHTLETHIYRLRSKLTALSPKPCDIVTLEGSYRLVKDE